MWAQVYRGFQKKCNQPDQPVPQQINIDLCVTLFLANYILEILHI